MNNLTLPETLHTIFEEQKDLDSTLATLMATTVDLLNCDRSFLYVRDPDTRLGKAAYCYCRDASIPNVTNEQWQQESPDLEKEDPMFAAALHCQPTIFVEDIETAAPEVVNREFERKNFGHRALIHAHLCCNGKLWGILQPCVFSQPRIWTESDQKLITAIAHRTTPLVIEYVQRNLILITGD